MRLGLSSAAAPDADLDELIAACARRGLAALELRAGDGHGIDPEQHTLFRIAAHEQTERAGVRITGYRVAEPRDVRKWACLAQSIDAPILVDGANAEQRVEDAERLRAEGARVAVVVRGACAPCEASIAAAASLDVAWDADPAIQSFQLQADHMLADFAERLSHIDLIGGGPEALLQEGRGVADLMCRLALTGFAGTLALVPSSSRYRVAWQTWLGRRGWGCGSGGGGGTSQPAVVRIANTRP